MKAKIALLLLSVGLLVSLTSEIESQATEDYSVEYVTSVSPDLKYAILKTTDWDDRGVIHHKPARVLRLRLVRVLDIERGLFETIRELPIEYSVIEFCDTSTIIITVLTEPGFDQYLRKLMLYKFLETDSATVLYDSASATFDLQGGAGFKYSDSVLVYQNLELNDSTGISGIDFSVIIRRLTADGTFPVVREIPKAFFHNFSQDGAQILYMRMDLADTSFNLAIYDIAGDLITEYPDINEASSAQRLAENSPIYYLSSAPRLNIRCFDPHTGTDTSLTLQLVGESHIKWFALSGDSIVYEATGRREGKRESRISTINLK